MDQLDQILANLKREYEPDDEAPKRVRALIGGSLSVLGTGHVGAAAAGSASSGAASPGGALESVAPGPGGGAVAAQSGWVNTAALKGTIALLAVGGAVGGGIYARSQEPQQPTTKRPAAVVVQEDVALSSSTAKAAPAQGATSLIPVPTQPGESARTDGPPRSQERPVASAVVRCGHTLEELKLLSAASQALRAGQLEEAERALQAHRARFPASALARERQGLSLELRCARGATAAVRAEAERFVRADEASPISSSVEKKCLP